MEFSNTPTKEGYTFGSWYTDTSYTTTWDIDNDRIEETFYLYAKWTPIFYTITYELNKERMPWAIPLPIR